MKILITSDWFVPSVNGVVTSILNLSSELERNGHDVKILTLSKTSKSYREKNVYYIKSFPLNIYPEVRASFLLNDPLFDELISWKPDVIHSQCEFFTYSYAKIIASGAKTPIVHTYHTMYEDYTQYVKLNKNLSKRFVGAFSKKRLKDAIIIIAPTNKVRRKLREYKVNNEIKIVPTGIDLSIYDYELEEEDKLNIRKKYNLSLDDKVLLYVGRLGKEKNIMSLISYFYDLSREKEDTVLMLVGDGPYRAELVEKVKELNLEDRVVFTGKINPNEIGNYYKSADIFVSASRSETQGLTFIEAICNSLPLLCLYDDCLIDVLIDGRNGYFYENGDMFKSKAEELLYDNKKYAEFSNASKLLSRKFSKEKFAESVVEIYKLAQSIYKKKPTRINIKFDALTEIAKNGRFSRVIKRWILS